MKVASVAWIFAKDTKGVGEWFAFRWGKKHSDPQIATLELLLILECIDDW